MIHSPGLQGVQPPFMWGFDACHSGHWKLDTVDSVDTLPYPECLVNTTLSTVVGFNS